MKLIREINDDVVFNSASEVYKYLKEFSNEDREYFIVIGLNTKNQPVFREIVTIGLLNSSQVHARETFKKSIMMSCNAIIIAHNHPSGDPEPSIEDHKVTESLKKAGDILEIPILDHVVVGRNSYYSFKDNGEL